jgi:hypothetical protein
MDLTELLAGLEERRWRAADALCSAYDAERLAELAALEGAIRALQAVIAEARPAPENRSTRGSCSSRARWLPMPAPL